MRMHAWLILAAGLLVAADPPKDDASKKDLAQLTGKWQMTSSVANFKANGVDLLPVVNLLVRTHLEIVGDKFNIGNQAADKVSFSFSADATKKPKAVDLTVEPKKDRKLLAVYELEGATLRICVGSGAIRPTECKPIPGHLFITYQKEKPPVVVAPPPPPSPFPDKLLENAVREALHEPKADLTKEKLVNLYVLETTGVPIRNLSGLEICKNLSLLKIAKGQVTDLKPIKDLTNLQSLDLSGNKIADAAPLSALTKLQYLDLSNNEVSQVGPLSGLSSLFALYLNGNKITDISPLGGLVRLSSLSVGQNQIRDIGVLNKVTRLTTLDLKDNQITDLTPLMKQTELSLLMLDRNKISELKPLVTMAKADAEGAKRFAPYLRLYLAGNPLSQDAKTKQLAALKGFGVRIEN